jgi:hypothetical protein
MVIYNKKQLAIGTRIEMEHVKPSWTPQHKHNFAQGIAKQHLAEYKSYYMVLPGAEKRMAVMDRRMKR